MNSVFVCYFPSHTFQLLRYLQRTYCALLYRDHVLLNRADRMPGALQQETLEAVVIVSGHGASGVTQVVSIRGHSASGRRWST